MAEQVPSASGRFGQVGGVPRALRSVRRSKYQGLVGGSGRLEAFQEHFGALAEQLPREMSRRVCVFGGDRSPWKLHCWVSSGHPYPHTQTPESKASQAVSSMFGCGGRGPQHHIPGRNVRGVCLCVRLCVCGGRGPLGASTLDRLAAQVPRASGRLGQVGSDPGGSREQCSVRRGVTWRHLAGWL